LIRVIAHLLTPNDWLHATASGLIRPSSLDTEGFTHCADLHQVVRVANRFYAHEAELVIAHVDPTRLASPVRWEAPIHPDGSPASDHEEFYPHVYGPIEVDAITTTTPLRRGPDTRFVTPDHLTTFTVMPLPRRHWNLAAEWSYRAWQHEFPLDTVQTYLDQYAAVDHLRPLEVYAAVSEFDELLGVATLVDDDELPDSREPGPWIAAVWVDPGQRSKGVGSALVRHAERRARLLGHPAVYLYTEDKTDWYTASGWQSVRQGTLNGLGITVMRLDLTT
jgi:uncharacterized protein (DUF952 family)/GNAT superfamily N-acetyltransferase